MISLKKYILKINGAFKSVFGSLTSVIYLGLSIIRCVVSLHGLYCICILLVLFLYCQLGPFYSSLFLFCLISPTKGTSLPFSLYLFSSFFWRIFHILYPRPLIFGCLPPVVCDHIFYVLTYLLAIRGNTGAPVFSVRRAQ